MWSALVELVRATIFVAAHLVGGSLGAAVILVSAGVRLALLPLTLRAARQALHRRNGIQPFGGAGLSSLIQLPLLGALFSAVRTGLGAGVRFLWIDNLSRANGVLLLLVAGMSAVASSVAPATPGSAITPRMMSLLAAGATLLFLWSASSTVALSVGAGSAVSALQNWLLARELRNQPATVNEER